jgi:hypothetical protein
MNILSRVAAFVIVFGVLAIVGVSLMPTPQVAPDLDDTPPPVAENIATIGPAALCENVSQLRSERGREGPTVYWCEEAPLAE